MNSQLLTIMAITILLVTVLVIRSIRYNRDYSSELGAGSETFKRTCELITRGELNQYDIGYLKINHLTRRQLVNRMVYYFNNVSPLPLCTLFYCMNPNRDNAYIQEFRGKVKVLPGSERGPAFKWLLTPEGHAKRLEFLKSLAE